MPRWRKEPRAKGLAAVCQGIRGLEYRDKGETLIVVSPVRDGANRYSARGWYWYSLVDGLSVNTYADGLVFKTPEEAQDDAVKRYKQFIKAFE